MKTVLKFISNAPPYFAGDVAGFDPAVAEKYVAAKVAVPADVAAEKPAKVKAGKSKGQGPAISEGWRDFGDDDLLALAKTLGAAKKVKTRDQAAAFVEAEEKKRADAAEA